MLTLIRRTRGLLQILKTTGTERRAHPRHGATTETQCRALADDADMPARIGDVSRTGINLVVPRAVREETMIRVHLPGPSNETPTVILACVTNVREVSPEQWSLGCMFCGELTAREEAAFRGVHKSGHPAWWRPWVLYPPLGTIEYRPLPGEAGPPRSAELAELTATGVGLIAEERLEPGTALTVTLRRTDDRPDRPTLASVVYLAGRADGKWALGCQFLHELAESDLKEMVWKASA